LLAAAQTGTGKTAAFTLPLLQRLTASTPTGASPAKHPVRALVLTPTRELAAQVQQSVRTYGKHLPLRSTVIFGGVGFNPQATELRRGIDIVVATPGRLLDHVQQRTIDLRHVEILVLDEADRMLDMGFIHDIRKILALLPKQRQNLLFSATFSDDIRKLSGSILHDPAMVEVARRNTAVEAISQVVHPVHRERKRELLSHLVRTNDWQQVLVFTKTKHGANRLAQQLERDGIQSDAIHGNKAQNARTRALASFKRGELRVLVATDIAARGLDIEALPHVVNYDLPNVPEDYVHRIGRTGRAGASGEAVSLVSADDRPLLAAIEKLMNRRVESRIVPGFEPGTAPRPGSVEPEPARPPRQQQPGRRGQQPAGQRQSQSRGGRQGQERRAQQPQRRDERQGAAQPAAARNRNEGRDAQRPAQEPRRESTPKSEWQSSPRSESRGPGSARREKQVPALFRTPARKAA
jgi:ATP-dependent RNA helicase RhlE